ncbi:hypothetical protein ACFODL_05035 [Phenylobacterium terrae]|uniref:Uncharacterized protein n=1 Tax=Phenylobacterium terrae TaxID=2665495 RepID=A0ABW4MWD8_9CAUL
MPDFSKISVAEYLGKNTEGLLTKLGEANLDEAATKFVVGQWILDKAGKSLRSFALSAGSQVSAHDPAARSEFTPSFEHREWRDGEDLVEAEGINGFNVRFNALRQDLETVEKDLDKAFQVIAQLRQAISGAFGEFSAELNAINRQVHDCCNKPSTGGGGIGWGPLDIPPFQLPPQVFEPRPFPRPWDPFGPLGPIGVDPRVVTPTDPRIKFAKPTVWRDAANPDKGMIEGLPAERIDVTNFNGKPMEVWNTSMGLILTESAAGVADKVKPSYVPQALEESREFSRFLFDNEEAVKTAFPQGFTTRQFLDKFGATTLAGATPVSDVVKGLPDDMTFESVSKLHDAVAEAKANALVTSGLGQAAVVGAVGLNPQAEIAEVPIGSIKFADEQTTEALRAAGVRTLGDLANKDVAEIRTTLENAGIATSMGQAASLRGMGLTVTRLGGFGR